jgi:hypothetical protein
LIILFSNDLVESKKTKENIEVDCLLINHKFHDEFGYTKGDFDDHKSKLISKQKPRGLIKKTVSEVSSELASKKAPKLVSKEAIKRVVKPRKKSVDKPSKVTKNLILQKKFDFPKLPKP